jgi:hypothetical protein
MAASEQKLITIDIPHALEKPNREPSASITAAPVRLRPWRPGAHRALAPPPCVRDHGAFPSSRTQVIKPLLLHVGFEWVYRAAMAFVTAQRSLIASSNCRGLQRTQDCLNNGGSRADLYAGCCMAERTDHKRHHGSHGEDPTGKGRARWATRRKNQLNANAGSTENRTVPRWPQRCHGGEGQIAARRLRDSETWDQRGPGAGGAGHGLRRLRVR